MAFLHIHHAMANKALAISSAEAKTDSEFWNPSKTRLREIVWSGAADFKDKWFPEIITDDDRQIVLNYLEAAHV